VPVGVFASGAALVAVVGRRGFMPLDQSIVFDAGWRILDGQVPLRDFATPNGFVPAVVQAATFAVFGVTWSSYVLHAAVLNGVFGVLVLHLLKRLALPTATAAIYALASVVVFHPPYGTPSIEQPSFFFALVALLLAVIAAQDADAKGDWATAAIPPALALAMLSKQIPALLVVPVVLLVLFSRPGRRRRLRWLGLSTLATAAAITAIALAAGVPGADALHHVWTLPRSVGARRLAADPSPLWGVLVPPWALLAPVVTMTGTAVLTVCSLRRRGRLARVPGPVLAGVVLALAAGFAVLVALPSPPLVRGVRGPPAQAPLLGALAGCSVVVASVVLVASRSAIDEPRAGARADRPLPMWTMVLFPLTLVMVGTTFVVVTNNQIENGAAYTFLALGALHAAVGRLGRPAGLGTGALRVGIVIALPLIAAIDAAHFHLDVNQTRVVHDFVFDSARASSKGLPPGFDVQLDGPLTYGAGELRLLVEEVMRMPGAVFFFGDTTVVPGLAGKSSAGPSLWWHPGLVSPPLGTPGHAAFDERAAGVLGQSEVAGLVVEAAANPWRSLQPTPLRTPHWAARATWTGVRLIDFPETLAVAQARRCRLVEIGAFTVVHFSCSGPSAAGKAASGTS
jgi:hypothetical protein